MANRTLERKTLELLERRPGIEHGSLVEELGIDDEQAFDLYDSLVGKGKVDLRSHLLKRLSVKQARRSKPGMVLLAEDAPLYNELKGDPPTKYSRQCLRCGDWLEEGDRYLSQLQCWLDGTSAYICGYGCSEVVSERNWAHLEAALPGFLGNRHPEKVPDDEWTEFLENVGVVGEMEPEWWLEPLTRTRLELGSLEISPDFSTPVLVKGKSGWRLERMKPGTRRRTPLQETAAAWDWNIKMRLKNGGRAPAGVGAPAWRAAHIEAWQACIAWEQLTKDEQSSVLRFLRSRKQPGQVVADVLEHLKGYSDEDGEVVHDNPANVRAALRAAPDIRSSIEAKEFSGAAWHRLFDAALDDSNIPDFGADAVCLLMNGMYALDCGRLPQPAFFSSYKQLKPIDYEGPRDGFDAFLFDALRSGAPFIPLDPKRRKPPHLPSRQ